MDESGPPPPPTEESVSRVLNAFTSDEQLQILVQLKILAQNNPIQTRQLLLQNPQLAYAALDIMIRLKLIDETVVNVIF